MISLIARLIFTFAISFVIDIPTGTSIMGDSSLPEIMIMSVAVTGFIVAMAELPVLRKGLIAIPVLLAACYKYIPQIIRETAEFLIWTAGFLYGNLPVQTEYALILMFIADCLVAYCVYTLIQYKKYAFYIGLGGFSILAVQSYIGIGIAPLAAVLFAAELIFLILYQHGSLDSRRSAAWVTVMTVSIFSVTYFMPPVFKPFEVSEAQSLASVLFKNYTAGKDGEAGTDYVELGGPREADKTIVMEVISPESTYLRGKVYDEYNGKGWYKSQYRWRSNQDDSHIDPDFAGQISYRTVVQEITKINMGETIYAAYTPVWLDLGSDSEYYMDDDREIRSGSPNEKKYEVTSAIPYVGFDKLRKSGYNYPKNVERYLQLPQELPERVGELAGAITKDSNNPYDTAFALQKYLKSLDYKLDVPKTPADRDFTDYFLFDLKQGYCTYFATAMAVMLRTQGIPARYVEGYAMPAQPDSGTIYYIGKSMAHAWVEVYFNGFGWMSFDPTPLYGGFDYTSVLDRQYDDPDDGTRDSDILGQVQNRYVTKPQIDRQDFKYDVFYWLTIPLLICIIGITALHLRSYIFMKRLSKTGLILYYNSRIVNILSRMDIKIEKGETMRELCEKALEIISLNDIINIYEDVLYGKKTPGDDDTTKMRLKYRRALRLYREKAGNMPYLTDRIFNMI